MWPIFRPPGSGIVIELNLQAPTVGRAYDLHVPLELARNYNRNWLEKRRDLGVTNFYNPCFEIADREFAGVDHSEMKRPALRPGFGVSELASD